MAGELYINSDIFVDGKIKLETVPNNIGTVLTYNETTNEISFRTNSQFISDLDLATQNWVSNNYIPKTHPVYGITQGQIDNWNNLVNISGNYVTLNTEQIISARKVINKDLGTNDYIGTAQHFAQFQIGRVSDQKSLEFAVTDDGISYIQSKEAGVGYNPLILNRNNSGGVAIGGIPITGYGLTVSGSIYSTEIFYGNGFRKFGSNDGWVLLGGGGHTLLSDFITETSWNSVTGKKWFKTDGGNNWDNNTVRIQGINGYDAGLTFYRDGIDVGQIIFDGYNFKTTNSNNDGYKPIISSHFIKNGSDGDHILLGDGNHKSIYDFSLVNHTHKSLYNDQGGFVLDTHTLLEDYKFKYIQQISKSSQGSSNMFESPNNANAIISIGTHVGGYGQLLGFNGDGEIFTKLVGDGFYNPTWRQLAYRDWVTTQGDIKYFNNNPINYVGNTFNLNSISKSGFYTIGHGTLNSGDYTLNTPQDGSRMLLHYETEGIYTATQIQSERYNGNLVSRVRTDGGWQPWVRHWATNDFTLTDVNNWKNFVLYGATQTWVNQNTVHAIYDTEGNYITDFDSLNGKTQIGSINANNNWWHTINIQHRNGTQDGSLWATQIRIDMTGGTNKFQFRQLNNGNYNDWKTIYHNENTDNLIKRGDNKESILLSDLGITDLNNLKQTGIFRGVTLLNAPKSSLSWFFITCEYHFDGWATQTAVAYGTDASILQNRIFKRALTNGNTWSDWEEMWSTVHFTQTNINNWNNLVNTSGNYVTINTEQTITSKKVLSGATDNTYTGATLMVNGNGANNTVYPTISFHQPTLYAGTISYRNDIEFAFMNINANSYKYIKSLGFRKDGSDDSYVLLGDGGHKSISDFLTNTSNNIWFKYDISGVYWGLKSDRYYAFLTEGNTNQKILTGGVLSSDLYSDNQYIPLNGIHAKGYVQSDSGFVNRYYKVNQRNRIWNFGDSQDWGLSYFQGSYHSLGEGISFHFGDGSSYQFFVKDNGRIYSSIDGNSYEWKVGYNRSISSTSYSHGDNGDVLNITTTEGGLHNPTRSGFKVLDTRFTTILGNPDGSASYLPNGNNDGISNRVSSVFHVSPLYNDWASSLIVKGWSGAYKAWRLTGTAGPNDNEDDLFLSNTKTSDGSWYPERKILTTKHLSQSTIDNLNNLNIGNLLTTNTTQFIDSEKTINSNKTLFSGFARGNSPNSQLGPLSLLNLALQGAYPLYGDEEFRYGSNTIGVYNNLGNSSVVMTHETAVQQLPNRSGKQLRFNYNSSLGATPGLGGFILNLPHRANAIFVQKFMAKLPVGYTFLNAENYIGDEGNVTWLTPRGGTGKWETYVRMSVCGHGSSFGGGGHVYVDGPTNIDLEFYLCFAEAYEVNSSIYSKIREVFQVKGETIDFKEFPTTLITAGADSWSQRKLLERGWNGTYGDYIQLRVPGSSNNNGVLLLNNAGNIYTNGGLYVSNNITGGQVFNGVGDTLYVGNGVLPYINFESTNSFHFSINGTYRYWFDYSQFVSYGDINLASSDNDLKDIIWTGPGGVEKHRIWEGSFSDTLSYRRNVGTEYALLHSGNFTNFMNGNYITTDSSSQTKVGPLTLNSGLGLLLGQRIALVGYQDPSHYIKHFVGDDTDGFGINTKFVVKPYNDESYNLFSVDINGLTTMTNAQVNGQLKFKVTQFDLTGLNANIYYPVRLSLSTNRYTKIKVYRTLDGSYGVPPYSNHGAGFMLMFEIDVLGHGWGTTDGQAYLREYKNFWVNSGIETIGYTQMNNSTQAVVYLRGGSKYDFEADTTATPILTTSYYEINGEVAEPTTTRIWNRFTDMRVSNYVTINGNQTLTGRKSFKNQGGINDVSMGLDVYSDNGYAPGISFTKNGNYTSNIQLVSQDMFSLRNISGTSLVDLQLRNIYGSNGYYGSVNVDYAFYVNDNTGSGYFITLGSDVYGGEYGLIDVNNGIAIATILDNKIKYGGYYGGFDGISYDINTKNIGIGRENNNNWKVEVGGAIAADNGFVHPNYVSYDYVLTSDGDARPISDFSGAGIPKVEVLYSGSDFYVDQNIPVNLEIIVYGGTKIYFPNQSNGLKGSKVVIKNLTSNTTEIYRGAPSPVFFTNMNGNVKWEFICTGNEWVGTMENNTNFVM